MAMATGTEAKGLGVAEAGSELREMQLDLGELKPRQVRIKTLYCGLCYSDYSMMKNSWGISSYPFFPGHENVGEVVRCGPDVKQLKEGDVVGVGWHAAYCMACEHCLAGNHNYCQSSEMTIVGRNGGFANYIHAAEEACFIIPPSMNPAVAGPLLCGGATVWNPMVEFDIRPTQSVAVIGVGGLGHLALQFLRAFGCKVAAFTTSPSKAKTAMDFGAHEVINTNDPEAMKAAEDKFDVILSTVNVNLDWNEYIKTIRIKGRLHFLGVVVEPMELNCVPLIFRQISVSGTVVASPSQIRSMLNFAVRHNIEPVCEEFAVKDAAAALEKLSNNTIRFRAVLRHDEH